MLVSYVMRLIASEAAEGRLVGEVEDVRTGRIRLFRGSAELETAVWESQQETADDLEADPWHTPFPSE